MTERTLDDVQKQVLDLGGPRIEDPEKLEEIREKMDSDSTETVTLQDAVSGTMESLLIPVEPDARRNPPDLGKMVDSMRKEL